MENELIYEGKAKKLFSTSEPNVLRIEYKDAATALNGKRKESFAGKGVLNNQISSKLFRHLQSVGINSHFIQQISENEQLVQEISMIPLEVVVRNVMAGSLAKKLGCEEGIEIPEAIVEFYYKDDALDDPFINEDHIHFLQIVSQAELTVLKDLARKINQVLIPFFDQIGITLVDFKLEFGRGKDGEILLADEISPDTCRLWDKKTKEKLDKDVFRRNLGDLLPVYQEVAKRLEGV
ncbi:phosphoribosylaminoimidazole-succinocarboxamide synthase [Clostridia bacterium]|nr:phosphoribosylaminoimidazole-succinocarboxamide synthase [Clostridia bacterium]